MQHIATIWSKEKTSTYCVDVGYREEQAIVVVVGTTIPLKQFKELKHCYKILLEMSRKCEKKERRVISYIDDIYYRSKTVLVNSLLVS